MGVITTATIKAQEPEHIKEQAPEGTPEACLQRILRLCSPRSEIAEQAELALKLLAQKPTPDQIEPLKPAKKPKGK